MPVLATSSKINKEALLADYEIDEVEAKPKTKTELRLAKIWEQVLQHSIQDIDESFFDIGG